MPHPDAPNFDRIAPCYAGLERLVYGEDLQRARVAHLGAIRSGPAPSAILLLGEGDGRFLAQLMREVPLAPDGRIDVVEGSAAMGRASRRRTGEPPHRGALAMTHHHRTDVRDVELESGGYDLIVSHFFLDCFDEADLGPLIERIRGWLAPGGSWLISDFQVPADGESRRLQRLRARVLLRMMSGFFRVASGLRTARLVDPEPWLRRHGMRLAERKTFNGNFVRADRWVVPQERR